MKITNDEAPCFVMPLFTASDYFPRLCLNILLRILLLNTLKLHSSRRIRGKVSYSYRGMKINAINIKKFADVCNPIQFDCVSKHTVKL